MSIMLKCINAFFCIICLLIVCAAEHSRLIDAGLNFDFESIIFAIGVLLSVIFLQIQIYNYVIPEYIRNRFSASRPRYHRDSFFKGSMGIGYIFILVHIARLFRNDAVPGGLIFGILLIFFATLSKIKTTIAVEISDNDQENS